MGSILVDKALTSLLLNEVVSHGRDPNSVNCLDEMNNLFEGVISGTISLDQVESSEILHGIADSVLNTKMELGRCSRTSELWFQYLELIRIVRKLITADQIGLRAMHLDAMREALPVFAAAGHSNYPKSSYLYLQNMHKLEYANPAVQSMFTEGRCVVRRSDRYWAGLAHDLVTEQVLMHSLKTSGDLTRGSSMAEVNRSIWLLSAPIANECQ